MLYNTTLVWYKFYIPFFHPQSYPLITRSVCTCRLRTSQSTIPLTYRPWKRLQNLSPISHIYFTFECNRLFCSFFFFPWQIWSVWAAFWVPPGVMNLSSLLTQCIHVIEEKKEKKSVICHVYIIHACKFFLFFFPGQISRAPPGVNMAAAFQIPVQILKCHSFFIPYSPMFHPCM